MIAQPHRPKNGALVLPIFSLLFLSGHLPADIVRPHEPGLMTRIGIAETTPLEFLVGNPEKIEFTVTSWSEGDSYLIRSESDFHAVFPAPIEQVLAVLLDYEGTKNVYPRVKESVIVDAENGIKVRHAVKTDLEVRVLGFGDQYTYITNNWVERNESGAYIQRFNLDSSPDGKINQMVGNWYIQEVDVAGEQFTYIRQFAIIGITQGSTAMEIAIRAFGVLSLRQQFRQLYDAVRLSYGEETVLPMR